MKRYIYIISTILCIIISTNNVIAEYDYFTYQINDIGNNQLEVLFTVHVEGNPGVSGCNDKCLWDFGDGMVKEYDKQWYFTHIYDLNNSSIISNGYFTVDVKLIYKVFSSSTIEADCSESDRFEQIQSIKYFIGGTVFDADFYISPNLYEYQVGDKIDFYLKLNPLVVDNLNNLTYVFTNLSSGKVVSRSISASDIGKEIEIDYDYTAIEGSYTFTLDIEQYGSHLLSTNPITIKVVGSSGNSGIACTCSDLRPVLGVQKVIEGNSFRYYLSDNSDLNLFKNRYKNCLNSLKYMYVTINGNLYHSIPQSQYTGATEINDFLIQIPDALGTEKRVVITFGVTCLDNDGFSHKLECNYTETLETPKLIEEVQISPLEGEAIINTQSSVCRAYEISSNNPIDDFNWISDLDIAFSGNINNTNLEHGDVLKFNYQSNYTESDRELFIKLFFYGENENSYSIVNGEKVHYRTVHVVQPTMLTDFEAVSDNLVGIPEFDYPTGTTYFSITGINGEIYFADPSVISLEAITEAVGVNTAPGEIEIVCYDKDNNQRYIQTFSIRNLCFPYFLKEDALKYDIYIINVSTVLGYGGEPSIGNFVLEPNKTLLLSSKEFITLTEGFHAKSGSYFNAKIKACNDRKGDEEPELLEQQENTTPSATKEIILLDIEPIDNSSFTVYPNPTSGIFNIDISTIEKEVKFIQVYDISGSIIQTIEIENKDIQEVDLTDYSAGVYIIKVFTGEKYYFNKIIKQ